MPADLFGFAEQDDFSTFRASFLDNGNLELGSQSLTSTTNDPGIWADSYTSGDAPISQSLMGMLPSGTVAILFSITSERKQGESNDGYLDNASFVLSDITPPGIVIPLPGAPPMLLTGLIGLGFVARQSV